MWYAIIKWVTIEKNIYSILIITFIIIIIIKIFIVIITLITVISFRIIIIIIIIIIACTGLLRHAMKNLISWISFLRKQHVNIRSSRPDVSSKKGAPNNFTKFAENRLCQGLFFELQAEACNLIKKETDTDVFLWCLWNFSEHLIL